MYSTTLSTTTLVAVGRKSPQSAEYAVENRQAEYQRYLDGSLANVRYQPFDPSESWAWQRGWLNSEHSRCIPDGADPDDFEAERVALYARHNVTMVQASRLVRVAR